LYGKGQKCIPDYQHINMKSIAICRKQVDNYGVSPQSD